MPEGDTRVRTECRNRSISLILINGEGDCTYSSGVVTPIVADEPSKNKIFDKWVVRSGNPKIDDAILSNTKLQMPNEDVIVEATYKNKLFELEVRNGKGSGLFASSTITLIEADTSNGSEVFDRWEIVSGNPKVYDSLSKVTDLTMPAEDVIIEEKFKELYKLGIICGSGDRKYLDGNTVDIAADLCPDGT